MEDFENKLQDAVQTGLFDESIPSSPDCLPRLLVNDAKTNDKILTSIKNELEACDSFCFSVSFVRNSGVQILFEELKELEKRNIPGKILVSKYLYFTDPRALKRLIRFHNLEVRINENDDHHAKGFIFKKDDHYTMIVGSSNLTQDALTTNKEWDLKISSMSKGRLILSVLDEFREDFKNGTPVTEEWISKYKNEYKNTILTTETLHKGFIYPVPGEILSSGASPGSTVSEGHPKPVYTADRPLTKITSGNMVTPNRMQTEALKALKKIRADGKNKALLISATGTGKTYLSAFDVKDFNPNKVLFVAHRENILRASLKSFKRILKDRWKMGLFTGNLKETDSDILFSTIQTLSGDENLKRFRPDEFDYIIIDEVHHVGAESYQKIIRYFKPKFLFGMTATPERTDGYDIFKDFDHNIPYEIRLSRALEENMLAPFHYYGISDITVDGVSLDDTADFSRLVSEERVRRIIEASKEYCCDHGRIKGLIFCSRKDEAHKLSELFNKEGYRTIALTGDDPEDRRAKAIDRLEADSGKDGTDYLDYIFTVDIFNEGVDIPSVNQIIMLRPTQSPIVFVQQLGRGLRKHPGKEYLTVIDFIGNYTNNYMIPIALYGDTSYNKDTIRKLLSAGSSYLPGASTVDFDRVSMEKIFRSIDSAKLSVNRDLRNDYELLKFKLGRMPFMTDFIDHGSREPYVYIEKFGSYYNFIKRYFPDDYPISLSGREETLLEFFSGEIFNGKRADELILLKQILSDRAEFTLSSSLKETSSSIGEDIMTAESFRSACSCFNGEFLNGQAADKYDLPDLLSVRRSGPEEVYSAGPSFRAALENPVFRTFFEDSLDYALYRFRKSYDPEKFVKGFTLYEKYSRKDVCRILNWEKDESSTVYGYRIKYNTCPIFVTFEKKESISASTKYVEGFISDSEFSWMTRSNVRMDSSETTALKNYDKTGLRVPLFLKKSDAEGSDFYYLGDTEPETDRFVQTTIQNDKGKNLPIMNIPLKLKVPVNENLYRYIMMSPEETTETGTENGSGQA